MTLEELGCALEVKDIASRLNMCVDTVYAWVHKGVTVDGRKVRLPAVRVGRTIRVMPGALDAFLAACNPEAALLPPSPAAVKRRAEAESAAALKLLRGDR